jgi:hypothetical protein
MRIIPLTFGLLTFWEDLVFLEASLLADAETKSLAEPVTALLDEFDGVLKSDMDTRRLVLQAFARNGVADRNLDGGIRELFSGALHLVKQDRKKPEFTTLFKTHIGNVVKYALRKQVDVAQDLIGKLKASIYSDTFREEHTSRLTTLIKAGKAALDGQKQAEIDRVDGRLKTLGFKQDANALRMSVHGQLTTLAAEKGYGKAWVESFYLKREEAAEEAETEAPAPTEEAPQDG